jgi:hypothetical protein
MLGRLVEGGLYRVHEACFTHLDEAWWEVADPYMWTFVTPNDPQNDLDPSHDR